MIMELKIRSLAIQITKERKPIAKRSATRLKEKIPKAKKLHRTRKLGEGKQEKVCNNYNICIVLTVAFLFK